MRSLKSDRGNSVYWLPRVHNGKWSEDYMAIDLEEFLDH